MSSKTKRMATTAFVPVVHAGYVAFFKKNGGDAYVLGKSLVKGFPRLERDIRALKPAEVAMALSLFLGRKVRVLEKRDFTSFMKKYDRVVFADEEISHHVVQQISSFGRKEVGSSGERVSSKISFAPCFLRWDRKISDTEHEIAPNRTVSTKEAYRELIARARLEGAKSPDWWRQIGAILVRDGKVLASGHNKHLPHVRHQDAFGDPRMNYDYGEAPETYLSIHAEAHALVLAAREGIPTKGADMFVSIFPCPNCARLISQSGVRRIYYGGGYSMLEGETILKDAGVEIILVQ